MKKDKILRTSLTNDNSNNTPTVLELRQTTKKEYIAPKLTHEAKWDTVTMQFGGSFNAP